MLIDQAHAFGGLSYLLVIMLAASFLASCSAGEVVRGSDGSLHRAGPTFSSDNGKGTVHSTLPPAQSEGGPEKFASDTKTNLDQQNDILKWDVANFDQLPAIAEPPDAALKFRMYFPKNYRCSTNQNYFAQTYLFSGATRADASHPSFLISFIGKSPGQAVQDSPEAALSASTAAIKKVKTRWTSDKVETGRLSGITFIRQRWSGFDGSSNSQTAGFFYFAKVKDYLIMFSSQDREPYSDDSLKRAESAFHTFKLL